MGKMQLTEAAIRFGGTLVNPDRANPDSRFQRVVIDSRKVEKGDLFVALIGERLDGHQFVADVADRAAGLVVNQVQSALPITQWVVEDTTRALGDLARLQRDQFGGPLIALTGSSGKTSVKEMIASILRECGAVHATKGNLNNHIGVPLTLLDMPEETDFAVIEMGASGAGEIAYLCAVARPAITLINNVQPAHVAGFGSVEGIARAKGEIYSALSAEGTAVLNADDSFAGYWRELIGARHCISFSASGEAADLRALNVAMDEGGCCRFVVDFNGQQKQVALSVPGRHAVANALAAAGCALAAGAGLAQVVAGLSKVRNVAGRLQFHQLAGGATVIDDSYNANPGSVRAAIDVLAARPGRRLLVLGDMAELGEDAQKLHAEVGDYARRAGIEAVYTLGVLSAACGGVHSAELTQLDELLERELEANPDLSILVKGSRSAGMERVVERLLQRGNL